MAAGDSLTFVFPMWNEESSIHLAVNAAREAAQAAIDDGQLRDYTVLIVDDASTDSTPALADALSEADQHVHVVHHESNQGLGGTLKTGLAKADGDLVLYTDADLPCDLLEVLPKAIRLLGVYNADIVSAYRHDRTAEGPRRALYSFVYNLMIRVLFDLRVRDVNFAFKLVRRRVLDNVQLESDGSFIDAELLIRAHRLGFQTIQFGVDYFPRSRGVSTLSSNATIAKIVRELFAMRRELVSIDPLPTEGGVSQPPVANRRRRRRTTPETIAVPRPPGAPRMLIVNADDYGLTRAVSRGILRAHRDGVVTSTSVLTLAPAADEALAWLADAPELGIGVHLAAVGEDPPLLSASEIPTLVDARGRLAASWRVFLPRLLAGRVDADDLRREFAAQVEKVTQAGVVIDHLDTHQHLHLWPLVRDVVIDLASSRGIKGIRVPRSSTALKGLGIKPLSDRVANRAKGACLVFPDAAAGLDEAGGMAGARLIDALDRLEHLAVTAAELSAHPGEEADPDRARYRWGYQWGAELETLTASGTRRHIEQAGWALSTYDALALAAESGGNGRLA